MTKAADGLALPSVPWDTEYLEDTSLRRLVLEHYDQEHMAMRRYLSFLGVDAETGQEIVQETFLRLHQHLLRGGDRRNLRAWMYKVAHNLARTGQAAVRRIKADPLPDSELTREFAAAEASPEQELLTSERLSRLRLGINNLSAAQKECVVLRAQGLKYREIGGVLNLSVSTVAENVQRGLESLKEWL